MKQPCHRNCSPEVKFGCTEALFIALRSMNVSYERSPIGRYVDHRARARRRGIEFRLTLAEWWAIWEESGHYGERGTLRGQYVMARHNDRGPYAVGNVSIVTGYENLITRTILKRARRVGGSNAWRTKRFAPSTGVAVRDRSGQPRGAEAPPMAEVARARSG